MAVYPGAIPDIPTSGWTHDQVAQEIEAIAGELGVSPSGTRSTVRERLDVRSRTILPPETLGYTAWTYPNYLATARAAPSTGQAWATSCPVSPGLVVSSVTFIVGLAGSGYTSGQCFVAIYNTAGTLLGQTADISASIGGSASTNTFALTAPITIAADVDYVRVAFIINATTMPQLACLTPQANPGVAIAGRAGTSTYTSPPSTITLGTPILNMFWAALG